MYFSNSIAVYTFILMFFLEKMQNLFCPIAVVVVVVLLLFYVHGKHLRSCRDRQLI